MVTKEVRVSYVWLASAYSVLVAASILLVLLLSAGTVHAQPSVQITSPVAGTRIAPNTPVTVVVSLGPGVSVSQIMIIAEDPIGLSDVLTSPPFQFPFTVPSNTRPGLYHLTASAVGSRGQPLQSAPVVIDIEPTATISALQIQPSAIQFRFSGDDLPIRVLGTLATGGRVDLTQSTLITYGSTNTMVARVSAAGVVAAVGPGTASVSVSGPAPPFVIPVFVPTALVGDLNGDGQIDLDDVNILREALNTPASGPNDARDLNHDGKIDALDARILTTLCTYPRCATHP